MTEFAKEVLARNLEDEMQQSYLEYAMSVIVGRALPDVRDGLKPVHRRVLYAMSELGNEWNKAYKKSARVVGDVIGKYHPHGDTAVYDTIVRMAQRFSMRYMLVDGQGNFGSVDGDAPAAMRYTEVRMARIAHTLLDDLEKETVDFVPNYDGAEQEPSVLPARIPHLLVNGSAGIAVGMATNIPPHNINEVVNACVAMIDDPAIGTDELMRHLPGPDFPTAGMINGAAGIGEAYRTGRGRIYVRARSHVETAESGKQSLVVTEIPYQVNKARLVEKIAELVKDRKVDGITELRDESDKDGMRIVIELRRGEVPEVVLNNLYQHSQMQNVFGINIVALVDGQPRTLPLRDLLKHFLRHRREVVTRRTIFDLRKARERAHVLEGLAVALANIDEVIVLIRAAASPAEAKAGLQLRSWAPGSVDAMLERAGPELTRPEDVPEEFGRTAEGYRLTEIQAQAILDLRLHRLTGLEQGKILDEYEDLVARIRDLLGILSSGDRLMAVIRSELLEALEQYGDDRRTEIIHDQLDLNAEDLIAEENVVVTLSHSGYAKTQPISTYQAQKRGGKGKTAVGTKDEDFIDRMLVASTHDTVLCFSSKGKAYWLKVYELPHAGRAARGKPIVNLLSLEPGERINAVLPLREFGEDKYLLLATASGIVKRTPLSGFARPRPSGIIAIDLREIDQLVGVVVTSGNQEIMLFSSGGRAVRFPEQTVRCMGRTACGVIGMKMAEGERVIAVLLAEPGTVLTVTENGFGKRTEVEDYPVRGRATRGVISIKTSDRNGRVVGAALVQDSDEIMLISDGGTLVRTPVAGVSVLGRNTQGVSLIRLKPGERLVGVQRIARLDDMDATEEDAAPEEGNGGDPAHGDDPQSQE